MALTDKQRLFVREYLVDLNKTQAAIRAGYSKETAGQIGYENLKKPEINAAITEEMESRLNGLEIDASTVLRETAKIAYFNLGDALYVTDQGDPYIDVSKMTRDQMAALAEAEVVDVVEDRGGENERTVRRVKIKPHSKLVALQTLGKHLGLLKERVVVEADDSFAKMMADAERRVAEARG